MKLTSRQKFILHKRIFESMSLQKVADDLGISVTLVRREELISLKNLGASRDRWDELLRLVKAAIDDD